MEPALKIDKPEPKDPGDHFPDFHRQESRLKMLERDVARLEKRATAHALDNNKALGKIAILEAGLAKQRALAEELFLWFESDCGDPVSESLVKALEEARK